MNTKNKTKKVRYIKPEVLPLVGSIRQRPEHGELHITYKTTQRSKQK